MFEGYTVYKQWHKKEGRFLQQKVTKSAHWNLRVVGSTPTEPTRPPSAGTAQVSSPCRNSTGRTLGGLNTREHHMTLAERLIELAENVLRPKSIIIDMSGLNVADHIIGSIKLSLDFVKLPPAKRLAAIVEEWDHSRIIREIY